MGALGYMVFPSLAKERDRLHAENADLLAKMTQLGQARDAVAAENESLKQQLAAAVMRYQSAEQKLQALKPEPLEQQPVRVGTAADVRRIMAEVSRKSLEESLNGV